MAKIERVYNIPIRKEWLRAPSYKRAKRAIDAVRAFLKKHMKSENVKLGRMLNMNVWERGIKRPPHHVKVTAVKYDDGLVRAELIGYPVEEAKKVEKASGKEDKKEKDKKADVVPQESAEKKKAAETEKNERQ